LPNIPIYPWLISFVNAESSLRSKAKMRVRHGGNCVRIELHHVMSCFPLNQRPSSFCFEAIDPASDGRVLIKYLHNELPLSSSNEHLNVQKTHIQKSQSGTHNEELTTHEVSFDTGINTSQSLELSSEVKMQMPCAPVHKSSKYGVLMSSD